MFAINGPSGPTQRNERRIRTNRGPSKEQIEAQQHKRNIFFNVRQSTITRVPLQTSAQEIEEPTQIFKGCHIYFSGRTGKISSYYLTKLIKQHGGNIHPNHQVTRVTHVVACNLSGSKADRVIKSCGKIKVVHPDWILESVKMKKRQPEFEFLVYKDSCIIPMTNDKK